MRAAIAALALLAAPCAWAAGPHIETMTSAEVAAALKSGTRTILIPTGGIEQNGVHLALGKHNAIAREAAGRTATLLGDALVAPVIAYTPQGALEDRAGHMRFVGTVTVREATFEALLEDAAASFKRHGFTTIAFLGDSGPNQAPQARVAARLDRAWRKDGVRVLHVAAYFSANGQTDWLAAQGYSRTDADGHAALADTSEAWAVDPALVRPDKRGASRRQDYSRTGASGSSLAATPTLGEALLDLKARAAAAEIGAARR